MHRTSNLLRRSIRTVMLAQAGAGVLCAATSPNVAAAVAAHPSSAHAQDAVIVEGKRIHDYKPDASSLSKLTELVRDTPQSINVLSKEIMEDRAHLTLNDALRNVPGITLGAGEMLYQGTTTSIRGFSARSDLFLDGMRDFGSYFRDPFNLEAVEVLQGPSSMLFGRGSTGGVINQVSKVPLNDPLRRLSVNVGNASLRRATLDVSQPFEAFGHSAGVRLNLMKYDADVPDRDVTHTDQYGIAPSLSLGLGEATRVILSYLRQKGESVPDYGLPWVGAREAKVDRANYYGFTDDYLDTEADIATLRLDHRFNDDLALNALVRHADYSRRVRLTEPQVVGNLATDSSLEGVMVDRFMFQSESTERMWQGQVNLLANVQTGAIRHSLVTGFEVGRESSSPTLAFGSGGLTSLTHPAREAFAGSIVKRMDVDTDADSLGVFALNTMKLGPSWQLVTGVRWDSIDAQYTAQRFDTNGAPTGAERLRWKDAEYSYRVALIYKPVEQGTLYLGWGTSFNPTVENLSMLDSGRAMSNRNAMLKPEKNRSTELGVKWELFDEALALDAAVFRIEKTNARVADPDRPAFNMLAGLQRVDGVSITTAGSLTSRLSVSGGYMYLDSEEMSAGPAKGRPLTQAAKHNFSLWAGYRVTPQLELGAGARHVGDRLARNTAIRGVPGYWAYDAMAKYELNRYVTLKLNITNLTDEYYLDQLHTWHVIPGAGLGAVFAVNVTY